MGGLHDSDEDVALLGQQVHGALLVEGRAEVVEIHDSMNRVVHGTEIEASSGLSGVGVPAVEQNGDVMVPVKEVLLPVEHGAVLTVLEDQ